MPLFFILSIIQKTNNSMKDLYPFTLFSYFIQLPAL